MSLTAGSRLGPYEIVSPIGAGGMGEVFLARDTRLDRSVAIKILPPAFAQNDDRRQRFQREAKIISQLNHPNICTLHDVGHENGADFLVMELIEGESLADRLTKGPLPLPQVLRYGAEIAGALDKAHRAGVVHRDLKPGNIMLTKSGAKLLDFGLAKTGPAVSLDGATQHKSLTEEGTILGTFQYMAPEQLEGEEADGRTDIFAFGAVLYEMATGRPAFDGKTRTSLIAAIVQSEPPPISTIQPLTPPALEHVIRKCLAKDREDRWQSAHDLAEELKWIIESGSSAGMAAQVIGHRSRRRWLWLAAALAIAAMTGVAGFAIARAGRPKAEALRLLFSSPELDAAAGETDTGIALSPDGKTLAYVGMRGGVAMLFLRPLNRFDSRPLAGTEGAAFPFWSPDGTHIAFFAERKLKKIAMAGGEPQALSDVDASARGGSWSKDGIILFAPGPRNGLSRVSADGGAVVPVTTLNRSANEASHRWPAFLPDGRHFVFYEMADRKGIYLGSLDSKEQTRIVDGGSNPLFVLPGFLLFVRERGLVYQRFDLDHFRLIGEPVSVAEDVGRFGENGPTGLGRFSASTNGVLAFQKIGQISTQLVWRDRSGAEIGRLGPAGWYNTPRLSPDATKLIIDRVDPKTQKTDLWSVDLARGILSRITMGAGENEIGLWSPDGKEIAFSSDRKGDFDIYRKVANSRGEERPVLESAMTQYTDDWSADGRFLCYEQFSPGTQVDLWTFDFSTRKATPFLVTEFNETHAMFSPDGKWLAYTSDESGQPEVYVQSFPPSGDKWQISTIGGDEAAWSRDGTKIYYIAIDRNLMEAAIATEPSFRVARATALFPVRVPNYAPTEAKSNFDIMPDGQRFLVNTRVDTAAQPIQVIVNWTPDPPH